MRIVSGFIIVLLGASLIFCGKPKPQERNSRGDSIVKMLTKYPMVIIGDQTWMANNLDVMVYRNGDTIPEVKDSLEWRNLKTGAWCYYKNENPGTAFPGKLYNVYAVMDPRGLAPAGWRIPSVRDWNILDNTLGGDTLVGPTLKGPSGWKNGRNGTNASGFWAYPTGLRDEAGGFRGAGGVAMWWTSAEYDEGSYNKELEGGHVCMSIDWKFGAFLEFSLLRQAGLSVRCVREDGY